jgi:hypothetical protein
MSADDSARLDGAVEEKKIAEPQTDVAADLRNADGSSLQGEDVLALQDLDPALNMKMHIVNNVGATAMLWLGLRVASLTSGAGN